MKENASPTPVNMSTLIAVTNNTAEDMSYFTDIYLRSARQSLARISLAIRNHDANALRIAAHGCAGSSMCFGAMAFAFVLRELEMMAQKSYWSGAGLKFMEVYYEYGRVVLFLETFLEKPERPSREAA